MSTSSQAHSRQVCVQTDSRLLRLGRTVTPFVAVKEWPSTWYRIRSTHERSHRATHSSKPYRPGICSSYLMAYEHSTTMELFAIRTRHLAQEKTISQPSISAASLPSPTSSVDSPADPRPTIHALFQKLKSPLSKLLKT